MKKQKIFLPLVIISLFIISCEKGFVSKMLEIKGVLSSQTKVNDIGFENSDVIGVFVVDYSGIVPGTLLVSGNHADNVALTYSSSGDSWIPQTGHEIWWNDETTHIDVFGYYPYNSTVSSVSAYDFTVDKNQSSLMAFIRSDFLWAKNSNVVSLTNPILLTFEHKLAKLNFSLIPGTGYTSAEFAGLSKSVKITGVYISAYINMTSGVPLINTSWAKDTITPYGSGVSWRAIIPPQTVDETSNFLLLNIGGVEYRYSVERVFMPGNQYNITLVVGKSALNVNVNSVTPWQNDDSVTLVKE